MNTMQRISGALRGGLLALSAFCALGLAGCASPGSSPSVGVGPDGKVQNPVQLLGQLPLPPGSIIRADQSLIIGAGDNWVGRVVLDVGRDFDAAYRFFLETYPAQGWTVVSAVRGKNSFMVMTRQERTATLEMVDGGMMGSNVSLTMAPRNAAVMVPKKP
ncbi:hypothetical protein [Limnohabitans sp. T6-20]|uniref:hypothetical protein n=1 Tax=Limnohabitans sp. T6-20 TaxID=1100725 RepID=UPI000D3ACE97|nr:hypothetical protein [Limnohabitans sp. T6-20]PUE09792.1 hypothetical protein B9Z33_06480 [Limnohabitans sp. T6-20]